MAERTAAQEILARDYDAALIALGAAVLGVVCLSMRPEPVTEEEARQRVARAAAAQDRAMRLHNERYPPVIVKFRR